jgi:hypothetical protein
VVYQNKILSESWGFYFGPCFRTRFEPYKRVYANDRFGKVNEAQEEVLFTGERTEERSDILSGVPRKESVLRPAFFLVHAPE